MGKQSKFKVIWWDHGKYIRVKSFGELHRAVEFIGEHPFLPCTLYVKVMLP